MLETLKASHENGRDTIFMMQYCVRCRERKNIEINTYWIVCVPSARRYVVAATKSNGAP